MMVVRLNSLGAMALKLVELEAAELIELQGGLGRVLALIERRAKAEFGFYQDAEGSFPAWPELADATKDDRVAHGFPENEPLLRTGELRDSISHQQEQFEGIVGSDSELMVFHEFGTSKMPARPVLGPAAFRSKEAVQKLIAAAVVTGLIGGEQVHSALGYDFETEE